MKINNSSNFDLDLFFLCKKFEFMCHFATGGLQVSDKFFFTDSHNIIRNNILNNKFKFEYRLNPNLEKIIANKREIDPNFDLEYYTRDFIKYAQSGLFSFDRTNLSDSTSYFFHLVAYPVITRDNIREIHEYLKDSDIFLLFINRLDFTFYMNRYADIHDSIKEIFNNSIEIKM
jgi:hypothetical protein